MSNVVLRRIDSLKAQAKALEEGVSAGLTLLEGRSDPESINGQLALLIDAKEYCQALGIVKKNTLHDRWAAKAAFLYAINGEYTNALSVLNSVVLDSGTTLLRCKTFLAEGVLQRIGELHSGKPYILPSEIEEVDHEALQGIIKELSSVPCALQTVDSQLNGLESQAVTLLIRSHVLLGELDRLTELASLLEVCSPASLELAKLAVSGLVRVTPKFSNRLREERPGDFEAKILAVLIEHGLFGETNDALRHAIEIKQIASNLEQKERLAEALLGVTITSSLENLRQALSVVREILPADHPILRHFQVVEAAKQSRWESAIDDLERSKDDTDFRWLQVAAFVYEKKGETEKVVEYLSELSRKFPNPHLLAQVSQMGISVQQYSYAYDSLEKLVDLNPKDRRALWNLALVASQYGNHSRAVECFESLIALEPNNLEYSVRLGVALLHSGNIDRCIAHFSEIKAELGVSLEGVLSYVYALEVAEKLDAAFRVLNQFRTRFWNDARFVAAFIKICYASGRDGQAHTALSQLLQLQERGDVEDVLKPASSDDFKRFVREHEEQEEQVRRKVLIGHLPWLLADSLANRQSYLGWWFRTQELKWEADHPLAKAAYSIYSTNSYHVLGENNGSSSLRNLSAAPKGARIAIDLSSLITLHQLELIESLLSFYSGIIIPDQYRFLLLQEKVKLAPHQISRHNFLKRVKELIERGELPVCDELEGSNLLMLVHQDSEDRSSTNVTSLVSVIKSLNSLGKLADNKCRSLIDQYGEKAVNEGENTLEPKTGILVDDYTLSLLFDADVLGDAMKVFKLSIATDCAERIRRDHESIFLRERILNWQDELCDIVNDNRLTPVVLAHEGNSDESENPFRALPMLSSVVAEQQGVPLMVDDRCIQALMLNKHPPKVSMVFGTNAFIEMLFQEKESDLDKLEESYLKLIKWRYRFLLPPLPLLVNIAKKYSSSPPGKDLEDVAWYLHACMRDDGLFSGAEKADPPVSMAFRYFQDSVRLVASFVCALWKDEGFESDVALKLTDWALAEFLPPLPRVLGANVRLAEFVPKTVLGQVLIELGSYHDNARAELALQRVKLGLGISQEVYEKIAVEVINVA